LKNWPKKEYLLFFSGGKTMGADGVRTRGRFQISEENYLAASRIIADTIEAELIKPADPPSKLKKHKLLHPILGLII
jgi:hypothetical protein